MAATTLLSASLFVFLSVTGCVADFQDVTFYVNYIYHEQHRLLLTIVPDFNSCYFTHVDDTTKQAFENCHHDFLEQEVYDKITSEEPGVLIPSSLQKMREEFQDVFADYRCTHRKVYELRFTFGQNYITQCEFQNMVSIGK